MKRILKPLVFSAAILVLAIPPVMAQTSPMPPLAPAVPGAQGPADLPAPRIPSLPQEKLIDGPVKKVDPMANIVQVGWFLGFFRTTLEVTDDTQIAVEGTKASLEDIREGARVKASYEVRDGRNIAKSIEVMPAETTGAASTANRTLVPPTSP